MSEEKKTVTCSLCGKEHEVMTMRGMDFVPCPDMPEDVIMPQQTLDAFLSGAPMMDQSFIVVK